MDNFGQVVPMIEAKSGEDGGPVLANVQLGTAGSFIAPMNGTVFLFMNDTNHSDNSGSLTVLFESSDDPAVNGTSWTVNANNPANIGPELVEGHAYSLSVQPPNTWSYDGIHSCSADGTNAMVAGLPCPGMKAYSLCAMQSHTVSLNAIQTVKYEWNTIDRKWHKINDSDPDPPTLAPGEFDGQIVEIPRVKNVTR